MIKYFPNLSGICSVGLSNVSNNTLDIVSIKKLAFLVKLSQCSSSEDVIISLRITRASTCADSSPYFSCLMLLPILSKFVSDSRVGFVSIWGLSSGTSMSIGAAVLMDDFYSSRPQIFIFWAVEGILGNGL